MKDKTKKDSSVSSNRGSSLKLKKRVFRKLFCMALTLALVFTMMPPITALAANPLLDEIAGVNVPNSLSGAGSVANPYQVSVTLPYTKTTISNSDFKGNMMGHTLTSNSNWQTYISSVPVSVGNNNVRLVASLLSRTEYYEITIIRSNIPSGSLGIISVAEQSFVGTGGIGTDINKPLTGSISVPYSKNMLLQEDIVVTPGWSVYLFCDSGYTVPALQRSLAVQGNDIYVVAMRNGLPGLIYYKINVTRNPQSSKAELLAVCDADLDFSGAAGNGSKAVPFLYGSNININPGYLQLETADIRVSQYATIELYDSRYFDNKVSSVSLTEGVANTVYIRVIAEDGSSLYYTANLLRPSPSDSYAKLESITISLDIQGSVKIADSSGAGTLASPYRAIINVPKSKATINWTSVIANPSSGKKLFSDSGFSDEITPAPSGAITLNHGMNVLYLTVTSIDATATKYYAITVNREPLSDDATLYSVSGQPVIIPETGAGNGTMSNPYTAAITIPGGVSYSILNANTVKLFPPAPNGATFVAYRNEFNAEYEMSGVDQIAVGTNNYCFKIISENTLKTNYYKIAITRPEPSADATIHYIAGKTLTNISGAGTEASPQKAKVTVPNGKTSIEVNDIAIHRYATLFMAKADGSLLPEPVPTPLKVGENHLYVRILAENFSTINYYDVTITREAAASTKKPPVVKPAPVKKPTKIKGIKTKAGKKKFAVSWSKNSTAVGYQITYSTKKNFKKGKKYTKSIIIKKKSTVKKTIKKLKSKKTYYVKVRAYKTDKGKKLYGPYSAVKKVKVK